MIPKNIRNIRKKSARIGSWNDHGFTLIQLMIVIAIIAIVGALSVPSYIGYRTRSQLREGTFGLKADLGRAKSMAIRDRTDVTVQLAADSYTIGAMPATSMPAGVQINLVSTTLVGENITFSGKGVPKNSINDTGNIVIENTAGDSRTIIINRLGRINIQ